MTSAEFAACNVPGKSSHWSGPRIAGLLQYCGGGLLLSSPLLTAVSTLTVVTAETASKQLRAVKSPLECQAVSPGRAPPSSFLSSSDKLRFGSCKLLMFTTVE